MSLTLSEVPQFNDIADADLTGPQPPTDASLRKVVGNGKFSAVRCEVLFMGYYAHGNTIPAPISPVDGYQYQKSEAVFAAMIYSNRSPDEAFTPGQLTPPGQASSQPQNGPYNFPGCWDINDATGVVNLRTSYYTGGGAEVVTTDGILKVYAISQRSSITVPN